MDVNNKSKNSDRSKQTKKEKIDLIKALLIRELHIEANLMFFKY